MKQAIVLVCCAIFTPIFLVAYTAVLEEKSLIERQRTDIRQRLEAEGQLVDSLLSTVARDVVFLSQVPAVRMFSSINFSKKRRTLASRMLDEFSKITSTEVFVDFLENNALYQQLSYLDSKGIERLKIDHRHETISLIENKLLEDQSSQAYFENTIALSEGEVYISDIEINDVGTNNIEINDVDSPSENTINPIIRIATPVFDKSNKLQGILVINLSASFFTDLVGNIVSDRAVKFVIDSDGNYIAHPEYSKNWSKLRGNNYTLQNEYSSIDDLSTRLSINSDQHIIMQDNEIFIYPLVTDINQTSKWYIVVLIPVSSFMDSTRFYLYMVLFISIIGILFSLVLGYTFAKFWLINPIKELTGITKKISKGEFAILPIENRRQDEIGELYRSFNRMTRALGQAERERKKHVDCLNSEIAERKRLASDLLLHRTFFEQSTDAMLIANDKLQITYVNPAFSRITGFSGSEVIGSQTELLHSTKQDAKIHQKIWNDVDTNGYWEGETWERRKGAENFPALQTINTIKNENDETFYVSIFKDMSKIKEKEKELWKWAHFDQLTDLANRKLLEERIDSAISEAYKFNRIGSLIFLDLDNFKHINDSLGHNYGDLVLKEVACRLTAVTRSDDTVARLGGDEYVILLPNLGDSLEAAKNLTTAVIKKLVSSLQQPCSFKGYELHITTSMGIVFLPLDGNSPQKLLKQADTAMYTAKNDGKNTFSFYHSNMQELADQRLLLERELRQALKNNELVVYYQPQCNKHHELIGYEALVRWIHPERGIISPNEFIPVAEESDLILEIGDKVFSDVCELLVTVDKQGNNIPQISVNISPRQFSNLNFIDRVRSILQKTGVNPKQLMLEVTEGIIVRNLDKTISNMQILKNLGIRFSIDDFGTGYSSLAYLKQLPIDELKIDRSFVCDVGANQNDAVIVDTIVSMAQHLDLQLIAEGVETKEQLDYLVRCGCNGFQGYYFGHAVPFDQLNLKTNKLEIG